MGSWIKLGGKGMNYNDYSDIQDFYDKTGMSPQETFYFLLKELEKYE